jgi:hypothetical protein
MDDYTKYIILSHLHWIEQGITRESITNSYNEIKNKDIFSGVNMRQIQENIGYKVNYKEVITESDYEKINFLWLSLSCKSIDLSFVKFCNNLEEINISCFNEVNLDALKDNITLKKIIANSNKISNIEVLYDHNELEFINIDDNPSISIKPISHLKKIKELRVGLIDNEIDALNILKNNSICKLKYIIEGGKLNFEDFTFPYYQLLITKNEFQIEINIEGVEDTSSWPTEIKIPKNLLKNNEYSEKMMTILIKEISNRLEIILEKQITFDIYNSYSFGYSYHLNYTHIL